MKTIDEQDVAAAVRQYRALEALDPDAYDFGESALYRLGSRLLEAGKIKDAVAIFGLNVAANPRSSWAHYSLAEAYLAGGNKASAIASCRRMALLATTDQNIRADGPVPVDLHEPRPWPDAIVPLSCSPVASRRGPHRYRLLGLEPRALARFPLPWVASANRDVHMGAERRRNTNQRSQLDVLGLRRLQLRDRRLRDAETTGQLRLGQPARFTERYQILRDVDRRKFFLDLRLKRKRLVNDLVQPLVGRHNGRLLSHRSPSCLAARTSLCDSRMRRRTAAGMSLRFFTIPSNSTICRPGRNT